jgi:hypothetical protein
MKEQFVTYEIALKLKELGFDEECWFYFSPLTKELMCHSPIDERNSTYKHKEVSAPLWQQAIDWFRENELSIDVYTISGFSKLMYSFDILTKNNVYQISGFKIGSSENYKEIKEQAILKAIELCQNKK